jgi:hypothetical protein
MLTQFPFDVRADDGTASPTFNATVRISASEDNAGEVMKYMRSHLLRQDFASAWAAKHAPGCGIAVYGGVRPVFKVLNDRQSGLVGYEQDFRLNRPQ